MLKFQLLFQKTGHYSCVELSFIEDKLEKFHVIMSVLPLNLSNLHTKKVNIWDVKYTQNGAFIMIIYIVVKLICYLYSTTSTAIIIT